MKICLIQPPSPLLLGDKIMAPLGILTLGALLEQNGYEVSVIDLAGVEDWKMRIREESYKLDNSSFFGCTATTPQYNHAQRIASFIKDLGYNIPSSIGGAHITSESFANIMTFVDNGGFDSYCVGEGYNSVLKMCQDIEDNGKLKKIYSEPIWPDVNTLPYADRDLIDIKNYNYRLEGQPTTTIYSQYGCYYECSYCESKMMGSYVVRAMTPKRVGQEIEYIRDKWGYNYFMDFSDEMNLNRDRFLGLCAEYKRLGAHWRGFLVTAKWDDEMAKAAKESNCFQIATGIESFSPTILKAIHKPATVELNKRFIRISKKHGLNTKTFMILGLPSESWKTIKETYNALNGLRAEGCAPDDLDISLLTVYHGSNIYRDREKLDLEFEDYTDNVDKLYYKSSPGQYESLVTVKTKSLSKYDLVAARNLLEFKFKKKNWIQDYTGRKDADKIYEQEDIADSIKYAEKMLAAV